MRSCLSYLWLSGWASPTLAATPSSWQLPRGLQMALKASLTHNCKREVSRQWHPHREMSFEHMLMQTKKIPFPKALCVCYSFCCLPSFANLAFFSFFFTAEGSYNKTIVFLFGSVSMPLFFFFQYLIPWHVFVLLLSVLSFCLEIMWKMSHQKRIHCGWSREMLVLTEMWQKWNLNRDHEEGFPLKEACRKPKARNIITGTTKIREDFRTFGKITTQTLLPFHRLGDPRRNCMWLDYVRHSGFETHIIQWVWRIGVAIQFPVIETWKMFNKFFFNWIEWQHEEEKCWAFSPWICQVFRNVLRW